MKTFNLFYKLQNVFVYLILVFGFSILQAQDGSNDSSFTGLSGNGSTYYATAIQPDGKVLVGGDNNSYGPTCFGCGGVSVPGFVRLNTNGTLDTQFHSNLTAFFNTYSNRAIHAIAIQPDGKILIGGTFVKTLNYPIRLLRLNSDGTMDTGFLSGYNQGANGFISETDVVIKSISIQQDGKIIVSGEFPTFNGGMPPSGSKLRITRLLSNGEKDPNFNLAGPGFNGSVDKTAIQSDGKIVVVGRFTTYNNNPVKRIARLNVNGSLDTTFNIGTGLDGNPEIVGTPFFSDYALAIQDDGKILVTGAFTTYNGEAVGRIVRINPDGSRDTSFNTQIQAFNDPTVNRAEGGSLLIQSDGKILVGGKFATVNSISRNNVVKLNADGSVDESFNIGGILGSNTAYVRSLSIQEDGKVIIAGFSGTSPVLRRFNNTLSPPLPEAPSGLTATPGNEQITLNFTPGAEGGSPITNYEYTLDGGTNWIALNPAVTSSPVTITGLTGGITYTVQLRAISDLGEGEASSSIQATPFAVPNAPSNLTATAGNGQLTINFTAGSDGGSPITNYEYTLDGGSTWILLNPADTLSPVTITGLNNGETYTVALRAVNQVGSGAASSPITIFIPPLPPAAPSNLIATPGQEEITIVFNEQSDGGSPITNYEYTLDGGTTWIPFNPAATSSPVTITGLTNGTTYTVQLRAVSELGAGEASNSIQATPFTLPDAPSNLTATPGNGQLTINFTDGDDGGSSIINYEYTLDGGDTWIAFSPAVLSPPVTITGLNNGETYTVALRAVNEGGSGDASSPVTEFIPPVEPGAPSNLIATPGNGQLTINFTAGADGGSPVLNYEYTLDGGTTWTAFNPTVVTSPVTITGLTNNADYTVQLRAFNEVGPGDESEAITVSLPLFVTIDPPSSSFTYFTSISNQDASGFEIDGFGSSDIAYVTIELKNQPSGTSLRLETTAGLTAGEGYNLLSNFTTIGIIGTQLNINNALASLKINTGVLGGFVDINISATIFNPDYLYLPSNGHYYKYVSWPAGVTGGDAVYDQIKALAASEMFKGKNGYLLTITSQEEQNFIQNNLSGSNILMALTDRAQEGFWLWDAGPEEGTLIRAGGTNQPGQYNYWCPGEPNNSGSGQDYAVTKFNGGDCWDDAGPPLNTFPGTIQGYVVEFGDGTGAANQDWEEVFYGSVTHEIIENLPPTISIIENQSLCFNAVSEVLDFVIGDENTPLDDLVITASSSNTTLVPNNQIVISGSGANRTVQVLPVMGQTGLTTITLTVTDLFGGATTMPFNVLVDDTAPPLVVTQNIVVQLDLNGQASITAAAIDGGSTDNCGINTMTINQTDFNCSHVGNNTISLTVIDFKGNSSTETAIVTVEDNIAPQAICAAPFTVFLDLFGQASITVDDIDNGSNDACGIASMTIDTSEFSCADLGENVVTLTVTDTNGNVSTCTTVVTVVDDLAPQIVCPNDIVINTEPGSCEATVFFAPATAFDNCDGFISTVQTAGPATGSTFPIGETTISFSATDSNGNTATCSFSITVVDNQAPLAVCQNITIQLDENGLAGINAEDLNGGSTDNCGSGALSFSASQTQFGCSDLGANTILLTVTDASGNSSTCTAIVTLEDSIAPLALCVAPFTIELDADGQATITAADIDAGSTDNCSIDSITLSQSTFTCADLGENTITLTITDASGNTATCTTVVTVEDTIAPIVSCIDFTLELGPDGTALLTPEDIGGTSTDNCAITITAIDIEAFDCSDIGTPVLVTYFASDSSGNIASCTALVTVVDNLGPVIDCPEDMTVDTDPNSITYTLPDYFGEGLATATDNCTDPVTIVSQTPAAGTLLLDGTYTITLTAEDAYGNESVCSFELTVDTILGNEDRLDFSSLTMYPNPAERTVTIGNPQSIAIDKVSIYDVQGRLVFSKNTNGDTGNQTINVSDLSSAVYMVVIESDGNQTVKRLIRK